MHLIIRSPELINLAEIDLITVVHLFHFLTCEQNGCNVLLLLCYK